MPCAKSKEALRYLLTCLWRTYRVTKYNCDLARQPIVHQSCSARGQEMHILWSQAKECQRMTAIGADQFCLYRTSLDKLFLWMQHWQYPPKLSWTISVSWRNHT